MPRLKSNHSPTSLSSPIIPQSARSALRGAGCIFDQTTIDNALKKCFRKLHHSLPSDFLQRCQHADHDGPCIGAVYMYHGGNSTLLGDEDEPTPVCDSSHPNFCYLGTFFFWCKMYGVWGGWLSEPLLTSEQLEDPDVQMWLEWRHTLACHLKAAQSFEEPSQPSSLQLPPSLSPSPKKLSPSDRPLSHKKGVKRASAFDVKSEITSDTNYDQGDLAKDPVTILFWQKDNRNPVQLQADGPSNSISDILGLFNQQHMYELYIAETLSWAVVHPHSQVVVHKGSYVALKSRQVAHLTQWDAYVGKLSDVLLKYV
ncbi:hypothetical protein IW261DRAFT_1572701 [Armillaria novae-zelandiae]|uniref:Uncharacterized protein n=1 Tax=Armillaria novae-zelandiae TaxID=153914 RepID=A0AA39NS66_9AGAR|nr:hypothetical protein IW261DRAFT_1572701 [Armillaria novae-zelandiae]